MVRKDHFSVGWLSDYGQESEYLFIQNEHSLQMRNIIDTKTGQEFGKILNAIDVLNKCMRAYSFPSLSWPVNALITRIIDHQLSLKLSNYNSMADLNPYASELINVYCSTTKSIAINCMEKQKHSFLQKLFHTSYEWIRMDLITILFPNIEVIGVQYIHLSPKLMQNILFHASNFSESVLNKIWIKPNEKTQGNLKDIIDEFRTKFEKINVSIASDEKNKRLTISSAQSHTIH